ncbi:hypothetical protein AURANDRAFT_60811 [Aureococcus anophagefferens]|uniref:Uncharacterized protein n=1 Tax=Aureococcus anophagefferens TaxID=44056 RepID=F0XWE8_AURAN|nr:hypothetical protein AURANDRAFT_60811 [Aureococcus anophagefferens]EGB12975.1 hypothetical protein AURANDRAFT_60811 [Aureococcus anophagefferens]|eukprot:XP_009032588.1 hypothetical protein AURANDRAFT_60811 [Aureococcus anophagefferens]
MVAVLAWSTSLTIASALAATQTSMSTWADLAARAGAPAPRLFDETERLHGADAPRVRLWHDAAAWHPFANQVWLLLEAARIPHCRAVVPLSQYRRPGPRDDARLAAFADALPGANPNGVPYVQLATAAGGWGPPLRERSAVALLRALDREFPEHGLLPRAPRRRALCDELLARYADLQKALYGVLGGKSTAAARRAYAARMDAWDACYARESDLALCPDDGGEAPVPRDAPFLLGSLGAIDALLLPLLERCEANVPHAVVGTGREKLALGRWPALARLLAAARRDVCPIHALLGDPTTTLGVRLAVTGAVGRQPLPPPPPPDAAAAAAAAAAPAARLDAAARLCANGAACAGLAASRVFRETSAGTPTRAAGFAAAGSGTGRPRGDAAARKKATGAETVAAVDDALRATAAALLDDGFAVRRAAEGIVEARGEDRARAAAEALVFLAENTGARRGVPRDMDREPAEAFRAHLRLVGAALAACCDS